MSKKKAFTGSTMTLKDFHGGSIPSDLPLPSAPGVIVRPADRPNYDRQTAWGGGGGVGRGEYRGRPNSSSSVRVFDDKAPFLYSSVNIGRNFDEDERTPIDGSSGPRRTVSDEILHPPIVRLEEKSSSVLSGRVVGKPGLGLTPGVQVAGGFSGSYGSRVADRGQVEVSHLNLGGKSGDQTNVWAARKEAAIVAQASPHVWSEEVAASKLLHASALDKVSSGRWQTKLLAPQQTDVEVIQSLRTDNGHGVSPYANHGVRIAEEEEVHDSVLAKHAERNLSFSESGHDRHNKRLPSSLQESASLHKTGFVNITVNNDTIHQPSKQSSAHLSTELSERPKLNLLPRSKPLEKTQPLAGACMQVNIALDVQENILPIKPGSSGSDIESRTEERPKLFIRPPSQPLQQSQVMSEKERNALFGGARPRELVLKERGLDTDIPDLVQSPNRVQNEFAKPEGAHVNSSIRPYDKADNQSSDQWAGRKMERKGNKGDNDRVVNRPNWRSDGRKNVQIDKQQEKRQPSPETWRKPATSLSGIRNGKAASAVELAQVFSRSTSDPSASERFRTLPNASSRNSIPFSRLTVTVPDSRSHIHGH